MLAVQLVGLKMATPGKDHLEKHYADLSSKAFFPGLISYMNSGPVVGMVWEGRDAVKWVVSRIFTLALLSEIPPKLIFLTFESNFL